VRDNELTGQRPGLVLRSGRDTETVPIPAAGVWRRTGTAVPGHAGDRCCGCTVTIRRWPHWPLPPRRLPAPPWC